MEDVCAAPEHYDSEQVQGGRESRQAPADEGLAQQQ
jgi:hypothetical protein